MNPPDVYGTCSVRTMSLEHNSPVYTSSVEVAGTELDALRTELEKVDLGHEGQTVRIEIESPVPIYTDQLPDRAASDKHSPEDQQTDSNGENTPAGAEDDEPEKAIVHNGTDLIANYHQLTEAGEEIDPREFVEMPFKVDTTKWYILGVLLRVRGWKEINVLHRMLKGTDWEKSKPAMNFAVTELQEHGLVEKHKKHPRHAEYRITDLGTDYMTEVVNDTGGYHLQVADEVTRHEGAGKKGVA